MTRMAWGAGFTTEAADGTTLDAWFRWLGWGELGEDAPEEVDVALAGGDRADDAAPRHGAPDPPDDRRRRRADVGRRRVPAPAPAVPPPGRAALAQPRRRLRSARHRGVDRPRARCSPADLDDVRLAAARRGPHARRARPRQVPADDRLRDPRAACASPTPPGCASAPTSPTGTVVMHEGFCNFNAGTLGTSMVEGRISQGVIVGDGSDIGGGGVDHGHAVGRRHRAGHDRRALPARRQRRHRHQPRRRLRRRGRPVRHRRHARASSPTARWSRARSCPASAG